MNARHRHHGFTLIEILIALAILAIALTALSGSANTVNRNNVRLQEKTIALWIAEDLLNEYRIQHQWPTTQQLSGGRTLADHDWQWNIQRAATSSQDLYRVSVNVASADKPDDTLASLTTYYAAYTRSRRTFSVRQ